MTFFQRELYMNVVSISKNKKYFAILSLIFFSTCFPITLGFYYYDLIALLAVFFVFLYSEIKLNKEISQYLLALSLLVIVPNLFFLIYQLFTGAEFSIQSFYIIYNLILSVLYICFVKEFLVHFVKSRVEIVTFILVTPLIVSLVMFFSPAFNDLIKGLYQITKQYEFRFGGIWGKDVNQLGYYSSIILIWALFSFAYKKLNFIYYLFVNVLCFILILLSGMRTGIIVYFCSFVIVAIISKIYRRALFYNFVVLAIISIIIVTSLPIISNYVDISFIFDRFSFDLFIAQLTGESGDGQLGNMYTKWIGAWSENNSFGDILFSFDASWKYPDSFVLYYLANAGLVGFVLLFIFITYCISFSFLTKKYTAFMIAIMLTVVAFKGNFPMNNMSMFICTLIIFLEGEWGNDKLTNKQEV